MIRLTILYSFILILNSCAYYISPPKVETKTEIRHTFKINKNFQRSKWRRIIEKGGYERYDIAGRLIEEGEYGEIWHFGSVVENDDGTSTITTGHGRNYKKLNTVKYFNYDSLGRLISDECWQFKNNKKHFIIYSTEYQYNPDGKLLKEVEYDSENIVSRIKGYSSNIGDKLTQRDTVFNDSYEGITRIGGLRQDTTILDSLKRPIEKIHYLKSAFLYREEIRYSNDGDIVTELRYDNEADSLWSITEWQYNYDRQLKRKFWKVIGDRTERKDIYIYNRKKLLVKVLHYSGDILEGFTKYKYRLF